LTALKLKVKADREERFWKLLAWKLYFITILYQFMN